MHKAFSATLGLLAIATLGMPRPAQAAFVFTFTEVGDDVIVAGSGTIDLTDLTEFTTASGFSAIFPTFGVLYSGTGQTTVYTGASDIGAFGPGGQTNADSGSGDFVGVAGIQNAILVPTGYVSGAFLSTTSTYENASFASLGLTTGTYVSTWGSGENADSLTVNVGSVPEPATTALATIGGCIIFFRARKRRDASPS